MTHFIPGRSKLFDILKLMKSPCNLLITMMSLSFVCIATFESINSFDIFFIKQTFQILS